MYGRRAEGSGDACESGFVTVGVRLVRRVVRGKKNSRKPNFNGRPIFHLEMIYCPHAKNFETSFPKCELVIAAFSVVMFGCIKCSNRHSRWTR